MYPPRCAGFLGNEIVIAGSRSRDTGVTFLEEHTARNDTFVECKQRAQLHTVVKLTPKKPVFWVGYKQKG